MTMIVEFRYRAVCQKCGFSLSEAAYERAELASGMEVICGCGVEDWRFERESLDGVLAGDCSEGYPRNQA